MNFETTFKYLIFEGTKIRVDNYYSNYLELRTIRRIEGEREIINFASGIF